MNNERRKRIEKLAEQLAGIAEELTEISEEEREAFENLPEGLQMSERGQNSEEAAEALIGTAGNLEAEVEELTSGPAFE